MKFRRLILVSLFPFALSSCSLTTTSFKNYIVLYPRYKLVYEHYTSEKPETVDTSTRLTWGRIAEEDTYFDTIWTNFYRRNEEDPLELDFTFMYRGGDHDTEVYTTTCSYYLNLDEFGQSGEGEVTFKASDFIGEEDITCSFYLLQKYALFVDLPSPFMNVEGEARTLEFQLW